MIFSVALIALLVACASAFSPNSYARQSSYSLKMQSNPMATFNKVIGAAALSVALIGAPSMPAHADGAISDGTVFRARNNYGLKIFSLKDAVSSGDFAAVAAKKNAFDLFISQSNYPSVKGKALAKAETALKNDIFAAVDAKDSGKLKSAYESFLKTASLIPDYKPDEQGQSDSSGYAPTYGTSREFIYIR